MQEYVIETKSLTKKYGKQIVVDGVSIKVAQKDIYGFVGENGAGKTTLMKMIMGLVFPTSGEISLFGGEDYKEARSKIGCVIETPALFLDKTARQNLEIFGRAFGCKNKKQINEILEIVNLQHENKKVAGHYSLGMKQRLAIGIALLGAPKILVLDEPINGLDPNGIHEIRALLSELNSKKNMTIFISSHILEELSKIATKYGVLHHGRLIEELNPTRFNEKQIIRVGIDDAYKAANIINKTVTDGDCQIVSKNLLLINEKNVDSSLVFNLLISNGLVVREIIHESQSLEDYILKITKGV